MPMAFLRIAALPLLVLLSACGQTRQAAPVAEPPAEPPVSMETLAMYGAVDDGGLQIPAVEARYLSEDKKRQLVDYWTDEPPGTIIVDPYARYLYHVQSGKKALRYLVAVGAAGYGFSGEARIPYQRDWPTWTPTRNMLKRDPDTYGPWRNGMPGGLDNPLGARALYLHDDGGDTLYRIHGTRSPWTIGRAVSSGCIRLFNQDIIHLAGQVQSGAKVVVLTEDQSGQGTVPPGQPVPPHVPLPNSGPTPATQALLDAHSADNAPAAREPVLSISHKETINDI